MNLRPLTKHSVAPLVIACISGCPVERSPQEYATSAGMPAHDAAGLQPLATAGLDEAAIVRALADKPPQPLPNEETLCQLRFTNERRERLGSSFTDVKTLFGETADETQSVSDASLVYRFTGPDLARLCGISLQFTWRGDNWFYEDGDPRANYYLDAVDIRGAARPLCWPHIDPTPD